MATTFSLSGTLRIVPRLVDTLNLTDVTDTATVSLSFSFVDGTGAGEANVYWRDVVTVSGGDTVTVDLTELDLNVFGGVGTLDLATQKLAIARNRSETVTVTIAMGTVLTATLGPGGIVYATKPDAGGWAATSLTLTNTGGTAADIELYLVGTKAS